MRPKPRSSVRRTGFTLAEVMVTLGIASIAGAGILAFFIFALRTNATTSNYLINSDAIRHVTNKIYEDIRTSTIARVYTSPVDFQRVGAGESGDMIVLYKTAWNITEREDRIEQIIAYYLHEGSRILRFETRDVSARLPQEIALETLISPGDQSHQVIATHVQRYDGQGIFEDILKAVRMRVTIAADGGLGTSRYSLYNFVVTPRG